jgi:hypothetical protein
MAESLGLSLMGPPIQEKTPGVGPVAALEWCRCSRLSDRIVPFASGWKDILVGTGINSKNNLKPNYY